MAEAPSTLAMATIFRSNLTFAQVLSEPLCLSPESMALAGGRGHLRRSALVEISHLEGSGTVQDLEILRPRLPCPHEELTQGWCRDDDFLFLPGQRIPCALLPG